MTQQSRDIRTRVGYEIAKGENSPDAVVAANTKIAGSYKPVSLAVTDLGADIIALNPQLQRMIAAEQQVASAGQVVASAQTQAANATVQHANATRLAAVALETQGMEVQDLTSLYAALEQQERKAAAAANDVAGAQTDGRVGGVSTGFNTLRAAGSAVANIGGGQGVTQAASLIGLAELGPAAVAIGAVGVALKLATDNADKAADAIAASAEAYQNVATAALTTTTEQLESERDALQLRVALQEQLAQQANQAVVNYVRSTESFGLANLALDGTYKGLTQAVNAANATLTATQDELNAYNLVLLDNGAAAADAAADLEEFQDQLAEATAATTDKILGMAQLTVQIENQTAEARAQAADALKVEILTLERFRDTVPQTEESLNSLNDQIDLAREKLDAYAATTRTYADFIAEQTARQDTLNEATRNYLDAQEAIGVANQKVAAAQQAVAQGAQEHADAIAKIATEQTTREAQARRKADQQTEENTAQHLRRIQEIEARYANDAEAAVGNRDALALYKAQQQRTTELDKEQAAYDERQTALQTQLDEQLAAVKEAGKKAADAEAENYRKREQQLQRALQDAQQEQNRANQLALAYERQINSIDLNEKIEHKNRLKNAEFIANASELNTAVIHNQSLVNIAAGGAQVVESIWSAMWNNLARIAQYQGYLGGAAGGGPGSSSAFSTTGVQKIVDARVKKIVQSAAR